MRTLGKILAIAKLADEDLQNALSKFLFLYRTTPHSTTKVPPAELLYNRNIRGKIPSQQYTKVDKHHIARSNEDRSKIYNKRYADSHRRTRSNNIGVGDTVLLKQHVKNKLMTKFNAEPCIVVNVTGSDVTVMTNDGKFICRNKSFIKKIPLPTGTLDSGDDDEYEARGCVPAASTPEVIRTDYSDTADTTESPDITDTTRDALSTDDLRRSSRNSRPPERYGFPVPSDMIEKSS